MKYRNYCILSAFIAIFTIISACKSSQTISGEYAIQKFEIECLGIDHSGNQILRTWGNGINRKKAIEQSIRNAIDAIIFTGIQGNGECDKRPLLSTPNAKEVFRVYFNNFFDEAYNEYDKYVRIEEKSTSRIKSKNSTMELWSCTVIINREALRERLLTDGIIK